MNQNTSPSLSFVILLAMTIALSPLALDTYLPAFPAMAASLGIGSHALALSLSIYVFALSVGQLIGGPLSDKIGRAPVLTWGLIIFIVASLAISFTKNYGLLLLLRAIQAFGGGWSVVCVAALVRDRMHGKEAAKLFSLIGLIMVAAPAFAPTIGSVLLNTGGWSSIFIFLGVYGILLLFALKLLLFRNSTQHSAPQLVAQQNISALRRYLAVLSTRPALRFIALQSIAFSIMMIFITHSSFIYQTHFALGPQDFALLFGANIVLMTIVMLTNRALLNYFTPHTILRIFISVQALAICGLLWVVNVAPSLWLFASFMVLTIGSMGAIGPNNMASTMEYFKQNSGTASAVFGALQFSVAGGLSALSSLLPESIVWIIQAMALCSVVCLVLVWWPAEEHHLELADASDS